ncbi:MAG: VanZ family protein, partial [Evtepia sp.]
MRSKRLTGVLLALYLAALTWIILFKMQTDWTALSTGVRAVNLIPFAGAVVTNGRANYQEMVLNLLA